MRRTGVAGAPGHAAKRSQGRLSVRLEATLKSQSWTRSAILENISKSGAMLAVSGAPATGTDVVLHWHGNEVFGSVSWVSASHCGIAFESTVSPEILRSTLTLDETAHVPDELDAESATARAWFEGDGRMGFD